MNAPRLSIHRIILARLLPAWLVLSVIMGGAAYWLESRRVDRYVFDLASEAAMRFDLAKERTWFQGEANKHLPELKTLLHESQFAGMRLYDQDQRPLVTLWERPDPALVPILEGHPRTFPSPGAHHHAMTHADGRMVVRAVVSLVGPDHRPVGYFEGAYLVPRVTVQAIEARVRDTLVMVLLVIALVTATLYPILVALNRDTVRLSEGLLNSMVELMRVLGSAIAKRDSDTDSHNYRVTLYAIHLSERLGRPTQETAQLIAGAFLHDVGKIGIPDRILLKPGRLDPEEIATMHSHVAIGGEIVQEADWLGRAQDVVAGHHEWFDGSGYPNGLKGEQIPFNARLFAVVDVFDALTSRRPYKEPLPLEETLAHLRAESGRHFDPAILAAFETIAERDLKRYGTADTPWLKARLARSIHRYFPALGVALGNTWTRFGWWPFGRRPSPDTPDTTD
jgi:HD-GYP domain-containing protein (c-di-GMP phosphodiesterase class II)